MILRFLFLLLFSTNLYAVNIQVSLNHNPVSITDSFDIIFTAHEQPDDDPDFSPLENDFNIVRQSQSSNVSWINGKSSNTKQWQVTVMAKKTGNLIIPSIRFGSDVSETATVLVNQNSNSGVDNEEDLFLKTEVSTQSPYIQSQVLFKVLFYSRLGIAQAQLTEPELADALVTKIGEDSNYNTQINGVDYSVVERNYAIFPQKSGQLKIKPLSLTAEVLSNNRSSFNGFFFNSQSTQAKRIESKEMVLNVKAAHPDFKGNWLTAEQLNLKQSWSGNISQMKIGEPLTRTLTIIAKATTVGSLPQLHRNVLIEGLKTYPDQPILKENKPVDGVIAFREEKVALIPTKAGNYILPAIEIAWFNTKTGQTEIAKIEQTTLTVVAGAITPNNSPVINHEKVITHETKESVNQIEQTTNKSDIWLYLTIFFAVAWLMTLLYILHDKFIKKPVVIEPSAEELRLNESIQQLKKACEKNDTQLAKTALLAWGKHVFNCHTLTAISACCEARLRDEILVLNAVLYSKDVQQWQGKKLFQTFSEHKARHQLKTVKKTELKPLYRV